MIPLFLSIKGLGPYLHAQISEEDFETLNQSRLFLISGEIGAGKTTLFDAIIYALFGDSTQTERKPCDLISHFIKGRTDFYPEVKFKFLLDGKTYTLLRKLSFKKTGSEKVALWVENKLFSTNKYEVNRKIKELFGLEASQFKKVFLIPQGEYRNILLSKPRERKKLFETIFGTEIFSLIEDFFKQKVKELKNRFSNLQEKEKSLKNIAQVNSLKELKDRIEKKQNEFFLLKKELSLVCNKRRKIEGKLEKLKKELESATKFKELSEKLKKLSCEEEKYKKLQALLEVLKVIEIHEKYYKDWINFWKILKETFLKRKKCCLILQEKENLLLNIESELKKFEEKEPELEAKKEKLLSLKKTKEELLKKENLEKEIISLKNEEKLLSDEFLKIIQELKNYEEKKEFFEEKRNKLKELTILKAEKEKLEKIVDNFVKLGNLKSLIVKKEKELEKLKKECEKIEVLVKEVEIKESAFEISSKLKVGDKCPVCGAIFFASPYKEEEVKKHRKKLAELEKHLLEKQKEVERCQKEFFGLKGAYELIEKELKGYDCEEIKKRLQILENKFKKLQSELREVKNLEVLEKEIVFLKKEIEKLKTSEENCRKKLEFLKSEIAKKEGIIQGIVSHFSMMALKEKTQIFLKKIENDIAILEKEITQWENRKKELLIQEKKLLEEISALKNESITLQNFLKNYVIEYRKNLRKITQLVRNGILESHKDFKKYLRKLQEKEAMEKEVERYFKELEITKRGLEELKESGAGKIQPEIFEKEVYKLEEEKRELEKKEQFLNKETGKIEAEVEKLKKILLEYEELKKEQKVLEEEYPVLEKISFLISGKNRLGMSFHSFVLSTFVNLILKRANFYLKEFSFGRYEFVEEEVLQKDFVLEVFDYYTGTKREVKTLSGGESFIASLSLSLGTSDTILKLARTRPLECLFIDEGFGSLDENTLEKVISLLLNLATQSGRIIGIISHLKDLKERFPVVLEVRKNKTQGSSLKLIKNY